MYLIINIKIIPLNAFDASVAYDFNHCWKCLEVIEVIWTFVKKPAFYANQKVLKSRKLY